MNPTSRLRSARWAARVIATVSAALLCVSLTTSFTATRSSAADDTAIAAPETVTPPVPGSQGVDTSLPLTESKLTVNGRDAFSSLAITVNQTAKLNNQAVSITWTGGAPTIQDPGRFAANYLQIFQCWGDDDGSVPTNPGPPPEQCVQGAVGGTYSGPPPNVYPNVLATTRIIARSDWPSYDKTAGVLDKRSGNVWKPFRAVDGTVVEFQSDPTFNPALVGGNYWLNPFFNVITTNEIAGAATNEEGNGAELFQVQTGIESTGLGCGQTVQPVAGGGKKMPQCWLVVVPRGSAADENAGSPFGNDPASFGVATSPLAPAAWQHRIAIPLSFNPVDSPCDINAQDRRIAGNDLAIGAVSSWQPSLCTGLDLPPFSYAPIGDSSARGQLANPVEGSPGMVAVSRPLEPGTTDPTKPIVYAPLTLSGLVIGFNIERVPSLDAPKEEQDLAGIRVAQLNLTPRIIAKLLTQSYSRQLAMGGVFPDYEWLYTNPEHLAKDPDFLAFNPEFRILTTFFARTFSAIQVPSGNSDAATQLWEYVLADPEAKAWLDGAPDPWGMKVNPVYATTASANSSGIPFAASPPNSFPKSEPHCFQADPIPAGDTEVLPPPLCGTDWNPYTRGMADAAFIARAASDGARTEFNQYAATPGDVWKRESPQLLGYKAMLVLTDTPSAAQFGLQVARLSRAGDNGPDRVFIAPDAASLTAGVTAMRAGDEPTVLEPDPTTASVGAYPLTALTYAAISPLALDDAARSDYAAFLDYARGTGQVPGLDRGQLPPGYAPLPAELLAAAETAAKAVREMQPPPTTTTTAVPTTTVAPFTTTRIRNTSSGGGGGTGTLDTTPVAAPPTAAPEPATTVVDSTVAVTTATSQSAGTAADVELGAPRAATPKTTAGASRLAAPVLFVVVLLASLAALEITKRPRVAHGRPGARP